MTGLLVVFMIYRPGQHIFSHCLKVSFKLTICSCCGHVLCVQRGSGWWMPRCSLKSRPVDERTLRNTSAANHGNAGKNRCRAGCGPDYCGGDGPGGMAGGNCCATQLTSAGARGRLALAGQRAAGGERRPPGDAAAGAHVLGGGLARAVFRAGRDQDFACGLRCAGRTGVRWENPGSGAGGGPIAGRARAWRPRHCSTHRSNT